jgi:hypothetical protein
MSTATTQTKTWGMDLGDTLRALFDVEVIVGERDPSSGLRHFDRGDVTLFQLVHTPGSVHTQAVLWRSDLERSEYGKAFILSLEREACELLDDGIEWESVIRRVET